MENFSNIELTELAPILTIYAGMLVSFYALVKFLIKNATDTQKADREERQEMAKAFNRVAEATEKAAKEAEQRNGHLAEISNQNKDLIVQAITNIKEQRVEHQTVKHETVEEYKKR